MVAPGWRCVRAGFCSEAEKPVATTVARVGMKRCGNMCGSARFAPTG
jgi:hypothetical protein